MRLPLRFSLMRVVLFVALLAAGGAAVWFFQGRAGGAATAYRLAAVQRGDLQSTISATGTVEPEELVDVGAQVAGRILAFGKDRSGGVVDYGSSVDENSVLALIDDSLFAADVASAEAQLQQAKAGLVRAEADLGQLQAKLKQAERDWTRAKKLGPSEALSQSAYDAAVSAYEVARANVAVGDAAILQARSTVAQNEATLRKAKQTLDYCTIRSPVRGTIVDRRVNIGQTVVASLNAPSLFLIAKDLTRLQLWVAVNEADIGHIRAGQAAVFTVDAFPGETFEGRVGKVRLNATMTQNVVTYTVEVTTDNPGGKLLPYLTANVKFILTDRKDVLMVPNVALRYTPSGVEGASGKTARAGGRDEAGAEGQGASAEAGKENGRGRLWIEKGGSVRPLAVKVGASDGTYTEVSGTGLAEGMNVVIGEEAPGTATSGPAQASPFTPRFPGRGGAGGGARSGR